MRMHIHKKILFAFFLAMAAMSQLGAQAPLKKSKAKPVHKIPAAKPETGKDVFFVS